MFKFLKRNLIRQNTKEAAKYVEEHLLPCESKRRHFKKTVYNEIRFSVSCSDDEFKREDVQYSLKSKPDFSKIIETQIEKTFTETVIEHINQKGYKDPEVYKAAKIDRRLFSKIVSNKWYSPSKDTVTAIIMGLKLSINEAEDLYSRAGFTLSHSDKRDIVIEYFIIKKMYDLTVVNEVLYGLGERIVGR